MAVESKAVRVDQTRNSSMEACFRENNLLHEFLIRLPVKALFRSKCVSQKWKKMISEVPFINSFLERSISLPPVTYGLFYGQATPKNMVDADLGFYEFSNDNEIDLNFSPPVDTRLSFLQRPILAVAAAENGLLLCVEKPLRVTQLGFGESYQYQYIVCNPLRKQSKDLPKSGLPHYIKDIHLCCYQKGNSVEYKVVVSIGCYLIEVYSSETGEWKKRSLPHDDSITLIKTTLFHGCLYIWGSQKIFVYNVRDETVGEIPSPPRRPGWPGTTGISAASLCYGESSSTGYRVWILGDEGNTWYLKHDIDYVNLAQEVPELSGFGFHTYAFHPLDQNLVIVNLERSYNYYRTILYHTDTRRVELLHELNPCLRASFAPVVPYILPASLAFVKVDPEAFEAGNNGVRGQEEKKDSVEQGAQHADN